MQVVIFSSPGRESMLDSLMSELRSFGLEDIHVISNIETFGKHRFWIRWEEARKECLRSKHDDYLIIVDDVSQVDVEQIRYLHKRFGSKPFAVNVISDGRTSCWGSIPNRLNDFATEDYQYLDLGFNDCAMVTNRTTLKMFRVDAVPASWFKMAQSSGVGAQLTEKLARLKVPMYVSTPSLAHHGDHPSAMHPEERKTTPLIATTKNAKVVIGIATFAGREEYLEKTIESLQGQADEIIIYDNEVNPDLTDLGKFWQLQYLKPGTYFFSCDDDIIYPPTYVSDMIREINKHNCIITHHGRILRGLDRSYYRGHTAFACKQMNANTQTLDVAGTGVTAWNVDYFHPKNLHKAKDMKMADLVFSLEAAKQGKKIVMPTRPVQYFTIQGVPMDQTIYGMENKKEDRQIQLANEIWRLKYQRP